MIFMWRAAITGLADPRLTQELYAAIGVNPRFACVRVDASDEHFSEEQQMQFAAVTMLLPGGTLAVAFRGTDDSFVGWKEDFNMAFRYPVPAQHAACEYVCAVARLWRGRWCCWGIPRAAIWPCMRR